jgi:Rhodopirellula transposase DDE domain
VERRDQVLQKKYEALAGCLDEARLRLWAAAEARSLGYGGITRVARVSGLSRLTIHRGLSQLGRRAKPLPPMGRIRTPGGGRKPLTARDPRLLAALEGLVEPTSRGDPQSPLRWTCKSTRQLAAVLNTKGHQISPRSVATLLAQLDYSLQSTRKTIEGREHPGRDDQFRHINQRVRRFQRAGQPVISVDTKKKELVGQYGNGGWEWQPQGQPERVQTHDFIDRKLGKVAPYGVYDLTANSGWVSVGIDHDTAEFATESIRCWWREMGARCYPKAQRLLITADAGGSNGYRLRLWKVALQRLADELGLEIWVCHFPPGTSKWNKVEHRMFCHITQNWRGRPLLSRQVIVQLIGHTTTAEGLKVRAKLDRHKYPTGAKVTNAELKTVHLTPDKFHGEWNYKIQPHGEC